MSSSLQAMRPIDAVVRLLLCGVLALSACGGGSTGSSVSAGNAGGTGGSSGGSGGGTTPPAVILPTVDASAVAVGSSALPLPEGWQTGAFMQVFVRSYQDSDGDGIGDLKGLISRLDYLQDLGIR
ncbi:MAG: hypothetical protein ACKOCU_16505, partial [Betaproteobacteria bacterium]